MSERQEFSQELEQSYAEALVDLLKPSGEVLEIGFGKGYFASRIQTYHPKRHIIIESDISALEQAEAWSRGYANVSVEQGVWQTVLPQLGIFTAIILSDSLFDMHKEAEVSDKDVVKARVLLQKEKELHRFIEEKIPELSAIKYSDKDLEEFFHNTTPSQAKEVSYFMSSLKQSGQITEEQYEKIVDKHQLTRVVARSNVAKRSNPIITLLQDCLKNHMTQGSRFACFLKKGSSHYEDPQFFEHIITNIDLDYQERALPHAAENDGSLVMLIEKLS